MIEIARGEPLIVLLITVAGQNMPASGRVTASWLGI